LKKLVKERKEKRRNLKFAWKIHLVLMKLAKRRSKAMAKRENPMPILSQLLVVLELVLTILKLLSV